MKMLSKPEELVLLAVWKLKENAYGVTIRNHIIEKSGTEWTIGAIYVPLSRLTKQGLLEAIIGEPTAERGGKRKKYYRLTDLGLESLDYSKKVSDTMWMDIAGTEPEIRT